MLYSIHQIQSLFDGEDKILSIIYELEKEWNAYGKYSEILIKGLLNKLIITTMREGVSTPYAPTQGFQKMNHYLNDAVQYIRMHLNESPSLSETAAAINILTALSALQEKHRFSFGNNTYSTITDKEDYYAASTKTRIQLQFRTYPASASL